MLRPTRRGNSDSHGAFLGPIGSAVLVFAVLAAAGFGIIVAIGGIMKKANQDIRPPKRSEIRRSMPVARLTWGSREAVPGPLYLDSRGGARAGTGPGPLRS